MTERYTNTMNGNEFDDYEDCCADFVRYVEDRLPAMERAVDTLTAATKDPGIGFVWNYIMSCVLLVNGELPKYSTAVEDIADRYIGMEFPEE